MDSSANTESTHYFSLYVVNEKLEQHMAKDTSYRDMTGKSGGIGTQLIHRYFLPSFCKKATYPQSN